MIAGLIAGTLGFLPLVPAPGAELAGHYAELPGVKLWFTDTGAAGTCGVGLEGAACALLHGFCHLRQGEAAGPRGEPHHRIHP